MTSVYFADQKLIFHDTSKIQNRHHRKISPETTQSERQLHSVSNHLATCPLPLNFRDLVTFCVSTGIFEETIVEKYVKHKTITGY